MRAWQWRQFFALADIQIVWRASHRRRMPSYAMSELTFSEMYEQRLVAPLFRPWAKLTLDEVKLAPGERLLDVACGTGIAARLARKRLGKPGYIVAVDLS